MKKILALVLAMLMVIGMMSIASAATVTINRHSTWSSAADAKTTVYTPYKIFDADLTDATHPVYTISGADADDKVAVLPSIFEAKLGADGKYYITLVDSSTSAADIVAALKTMVDANPTLFPAGTATTTADSPALVTVADNAYSLILASNGKNLAVQTVGTALTIDEKNDYPTIDKQQKKAAGDTYGNDPVEAEIGKVIDYEIIVHIPADANKAIAVIDKMSAGLTYNVDFAANIGSTDVASSAAALTSADTTLGYVAEAPEGYTIPFQVKFDAEFVTAHQGEDIVITYSATVNANALVPTGRENEAKLVYDEGNYQLHDTVTYTTYFGGIEKVDGSNTSIKLDGVKFDVTVNGAAFNVDSVDVDGDGKTDYYIPGGTSNEVETGENGLIIIRGLDNTTTYTLTETETKSGYNLLPTPTDLTLAEDTGDAHTTATYTQIQNFQGTALPSTGGIGTTIFYVSGLIMVLGASIILVSRRRADAK